MPRAIYLTNSLTRKKELLVPLEEGKLKFYSCGPTVYDLIHLGNLRSGLVSDLFFRYFCKVGYQVTFVRNYTDIDDKIIEKARKLGMTAQAVAARYLLEAETDFQAAGIKTPTHQPLATEHLPEMIDLIQRLLDQGHAYVVPGGDVCFSIASFPEYGQLARRSQEDLRQAEAAGSLASRLQASAEAEGNSALESESPAKHNALDFVLWKAAKPGEPAWVSPWGEGRPGWHLECSAMIERWLGVPIDVHHGGQDLMFPHHDNEIAQSQCGQRRGHHPEHRQPLARVWLHHAFLKFSNQKMSKSLGNTWTAREFLEQFSPEVARFLLLCVHYRSEINCTPDSLAQAITGLARIYEAKALALEVITGADHRAGTETESRGVGLWDDVRVQIEQAACNIDGHFADDFNTPAALAEAFKLIRQFNHWVGSSRLARLAEASQEHAGSSSALSSSFSSSARVARQFVACLQDSLGEVMGIAQGDPAQVLADLNRMRGVLQRLATAGSLSQPPVSSPVPAVSELSSGEQGGEAAGGGAHEQTQAESSVVAQPALSEAAILAAIEQRRLARLAKDFARADQIRRSLLQDGGVVLLDHPQGTRWEYVLTRKPESEGV